jgi:hypothetical protein
MSERNLLLNGRFLQNLSGWTASSAVYDAGDGDDHYGVAVLATGGGYIEQSFSVPRVRLYSLHISVKPMTAALTAGKATVQIKDASGNVVYSANLTGATMAVWEENNLEVGLATGTTYTIRITNVSHGGYVKVDDAWAWFIPLSRAAIATRVHAKLGRLATDRSLSTTLSGALTEGSYTYGIDAGLRSVGAVNPETGLPDVRYLDAESIQTALDYIEREMLEQLQRDYAVEVDVRVGQRSESLSQIGKAVGEMAAGGSGKGGGRIVMRKLTHD